MSGTTIRIQITPGTQLAELLRAQQEQLLAGQRTRAAAYLAQAVRATNAGSRSEPHELRMLTARCATICSAHSTPATQAARVALRAAQTRPTQTALSEARAAVTRAEQAHVQTTMDRAAQQLVITNMLSNLPAGLRPDARVARRRDGSVAAVLHTPHGGRVGIELTVGGQVALDMSQAAIDDLHTAEGAITGCEAERYLAEQITEQWARAGLDVAVLPPEESAAAPAATATRTLTA